MAAYCTIEELADFGVTADATADMEEERLLNAIKAASKTIDSYLRHRYEMPIVAWGEELNRHCAIITAYDVLSARGYNPETPGDSNPRLRYEDTIAWLEKVAARRLSPDITDSSSSPEPSKPVRPRVYSNVSRGWQESQRGPGGGFSGRRR